MSAAAAPGPGIYIDVQVSALNVNDIFKQRFDTEHVFIITQIDVGDSNNKRLYFSELEPVDKIFMPVGNMEFSNDEHVLKINCPEEPPAAGAGAGSTSGGSRSRKCSTSRNRRKLRRA
jgi:hypothetical protein